MFGVTFNEGMVVKLFLETDSYSDSASLNQAKTGEYLRVFPNWGISESSPQF